MWGETFFTRKFHRASLRQHGMVVIKTARQDIRSLMRRCQSNPVDFISQQCIIFSIIQLKPTKPLIAACGCRLMSGWHMRFESQKKSQNYGFLEFGYYYRGLCQTGWPWVSFTMFCAWMGSQWGILPLLLHSWFQPVGQGARTKERAVKIDSLYFFQFLVKLFRLFIFLSWMKNGHF